MFATFGVPDDLSSDGGPEFIAEETEDMLKRWGVNHNPSSAYFPQSNGRAEVAVRITKRILQDNMGPNGNLNNDNVVRALLQLRNTPDRDCGLSSAEVLFGRRLKDSMPRLEKSIPVFQSPQIHPIWKENWNAKEKAIHSRFVKTCEKLEEHAKELPPLREGDSVFIQNQNLAYGKPNKWDREGTIIQTGENDQYLVRVRGTGRVTLRNRRFLRKFSPRQDPERLEEIETPMIRDSLQSPSSKDIDLYPLDTSTDHSVRGNGQQDEQDTIPNPLPIAHGDNDATVSPPHPAPVCLQGEHIPEVRRSSRVPIKRKLYDAATGQYV